MSLLMRDPRKLAALVLQGKGGLKKAPQSKEGGIKDNSAVVREKATNVMTALENRDVESLMLSFQSMFDALSHQTKDEADQPVQVNNEANSGNTDQSDNSGTPEV